MAVCASEIVCECIELIGPTMMAVAAPMTMIITEQVRCAGVIPLSLFAVARIWCEEESAGSICECSRIQLKLYATGEDNNNLQPFPDTQIRISRAHHGNDNLCCLISVSQVKWVHALIAIVEICLIVALLKPESSRITWCENRFRLFGHCGRWRIVGIRGVASMISQLLIS